MDDPALNELLNACRDKPRPPLPPAFAQNVWREIRQRKAEEHTEPLPFWSWLLRPQAVVAALSLAMLLGIGVGVRSYHLEIQNTQAALNLDVFGGEAPALPSTLLSERL